MDEINEALKSFGTWATEQRGSSVDKRFLIAGSADINNPLLNEWRAQDAKHQARRNRDKIRRKKR